MRVVVIGCVWVCGLGFRRPLTSSQPVSQFSPSRTILPPFLVSSWYAWLSNTHSLPFSSQTAVAVRVVE